jgi:hypothetical protein
MINESTTIHRAVEDDVPYFLVSRELAQDSRLGFETRGMLVYLLSKPANWTVNVKDLQRESGMGRDRVYRMINQCIEFGYMRRVESRVGGTFAGNDIHVFSTPQLDQPQHEASPHPENPDTVKPDTENQETYSKEYKSSTEKRGGEKRTPLAQQQQQRRRQTPEHIRAASLHGLEPRDMTRLVNAVLDATGKRALADTDGVLGDRELSYAQECAVTLLQLGVHSPEGVADTLKAFRAEYPKFSEPSYRQLCEVAGKRQTKAQTPRIPSNATRNADGSVTVHFVPKLEYAA